METRNEKWQSLRLEVQKFMPKEYCVTTCWIATIVCQGASASQGQLPRYVYVNGVYEGALDTNYNGGKHGVHTQVVTFRTQDGATPTVDDLVQTGDLTFSLAYSSSDVTGNPPVPKTSATEFTGWSWYEGGGIGGDSSNIHFAQMPEVQPYTERPNHS